jgi:Trypsin-like peptidase domain
MGEQLEAVAAQGLQKLAVEGPNANLSTAEIAGLEAVIRADGSRPVFFIRGGQLDRNGVQAGTWAEALTVHAQHIADVVPAVGRIGLKQNRSEYTGTGFLVGRDLVVTNRHVLEDIADQAGDTWTFRGKASIDFIAEQDSTASLLCNIKRVVFVGSDPINGSIDPKKLDLALLEIARGTARATLPDPLALSVKAGIVTSPRDLYVVGFPAQAGLYFGTGDPTTGTEYANILTSVFADEFGVKRLATGHVDAGLGGLDDGGKNWAFAHDASTLGGNSGSCIVDFGDGISVIGLHFGGGPRRENYAHALAVLKPTLAALGVNYA